MDLDMLLTWIWTCFGHGFGNRFGYGDMDGQPVTTWFWTWIWTCFGHGFGNALDMDMICLWWFG